MTDAAVAWGHARWPGCRVIHELVLGERRIDLVFVGERDLTGMELKSSADTLTRLKPQMIEYSRYLPEVWMGLAPRWKDHDGLDGVYYNKAWIIDKVCPESYRDKKPMRDELVCSRLLEVLWRDEACAIAVRTGVIPIRVPKQFNRGKVLKLLSRLLTGNEILTEVCRELRARALVGYRSDPPVRHVEKPIAKTFLDLQSQEVVK